MCWDTAIAVTLGLPSEALFIFECVCRFVRVVGIYTSYSAREFQLLRLDAKYMSKVVDLHDGFKGWVLFVAAFLYLFLHM